LWGLLCWLRFRNGSPVVWVGRGLSIRSGGGCDKSHSTPSGSWGGKCKGKERPTEGKTGTLFMSMSLQRRYEADQLAWSCSLKRDAGKASQPTYLIHDQFETQALVVHYYRNRFPLLMDDSQCAAQRICRPESWALQCLPRDHSLRCLAELSFDRQTSRLSRPINTPCIEGISTVELRQGCGQLTLHTNGRHSRYLPT
jgi:hypothetical protein